MLCDFNKGAGRVRCESQRLIHWIIFMSKLKRPFQIPRIHRADEVEWICFFEIGIYIYKMIVWPVVELDRQCQSWKWDCNQLTTPTHPTPSHPITTATPNEFSMAAQRQGAFSVSTRSSRFDRKRRHFLASVHVSNRHGFDVISRTG